MFDDFFDEFERMFREGWPEGELREHSYAGYAAPVYDTWESNSRVFVTMELPGAKEKDISIELEPYWLTVKAEHPKGGESGYEGYYRTIRLPAPVKEKPVKRSFKNGVLELIFEKDLGKGFREKGRKRIEVR